MNRRTEDVWFKRLFGGAVVTILAGLAYAFIRMNAGAFTRPSDIYVDQPENAVLDARSLIASKQRNPDAFGDFTEASQLPPSLRIHGLRYAKVHSDHIDLVVARNPDVSVGARIWAISHRRHHDASTRYREIYFFRYDNDAPESESNIR
ncbi:MAG: hypothetical protein JO231_21745 [Acidobacteria bacterium]|nr:hypothetical protein [Acidobacteriota bacterium]